MRRNIQQFLVVLVILIISGCVTKSMLNTAVSNPSKCPPPGTDVSFAKLVTPGFAEDYIGCDITTVAQFVATGTGAVVLPCSTEGKAVFRVLPPGARGEKNPLSGEIQANFIVIPKESAELIFELNVGDMIRLTGGNYVGEVGLFNYRGIVFLANTMEKVQ